MLFPPPTNVQQDFAVTDAGYPEAGLKAFGLTLLPMMAQPIVPIFNLGPSVPTLVPCPPRRQCVVVTVRQLTVCH